MAEETNTGGNWLILAIFVLMAIASLASIGTGLTFYGIALGEWITHDLTFKGWGVLDWVIGMIGAGLIHAGLLIAGFFFRYLPWKSAPSASLVLAGLSAAYILFTYVMLSSPFDGDEMLESVLMIGAGIISLCMLSLPPFLHWLGGKHVQNSSVAE
jgi:hypothetical protein